MYIGRTPTYGFFEKQSLTANSSTTDFNLDYNASSTSLLVVYAGAVQEPDVDYTVTSGGDVIHFTFTPATGNSLFIIYLGKELTTT